jgi:hypothetical protein
MHVRFVGPSVGRLRHEAARWMQTDLALRINSKMLVF